MSLDKKCMQNYSWKREHLEDLGSCWLIILKQMFKEHRECCWVYLDQNVDQSCLLINNVSKPSVSVTRGKFLD
jgi:hypothetical protein